jgi:hypothetical protein
MPFINEEPSEADIVKYGLREQDAEFGQSILRAVKWTRDSERDIYLRYMRTDGRREPLVHEFVFYWQGRRIENLSLEQVSSQYIENEYRQKTLKIHPYYRPNNSFWLPPDLEPLRTQIISDFKEALIARDGIYEFNESAHYKNYILNLMF